MSKTVTLLVIIFTLFVIVKVLPKNKTVSDYDAAGSGHGGLRA